MEENIEEKVFVVQSSTRICPDIPYGLIVNLIYNNGKTRVKCLKSSNKPYHRICTVEDVLENSSNVFCKC